MPTGYTNQIANGISFNDFIMSCARAFGELIMMRDEPHDAEIPKKLEPSDYHLNQIIETKTRLTAAKSMDIMMSIEEARTSYDKQVVNNEESIASKKSLKQKYEDMLKKVSVWEPPSKDHNNLKSFMRDQIEESIKFDCDLDYYEKHKPVLLTGKQWKDQEISLLEESLEYHTEEYAKELKRVSDSNLWLQQLRDSLK